MDIGIKEAKDNLSSLISQACDGERIFFTNRGKRVAELVAVRAVEARLPNKGRGWLKGTIRLPKDYQKWKDQSSKAVMKDMKLL